MEIAENTRFNPAALSRSPLELLRASFATADQIAVSSTPLASSVATSLTTPNAAFCTESACAVDLLAASNGSNSPRLSPSELKPKARSTADSALAVSSPFATRVPTRVVMGLTRIQPAGVNKSILFSTTSPLIRLYPPCALIAPSVCTPCTVTRYLPGVPLYTATVSAMPSPFRSTLTAELIR